MAIGYLSTPGTPHGPCLRECEHRDCRSARDAAAEACPDCRGRIGFATGFFIENGVLVHATCLMQREDD